MTHTTSDESFDEPLKKNRPSLPPLSRKTWGMLAGAALILAGGSWMVMRWMSSPNPSEMASTPAIAVSTLAIRPQTMPDTLEIGRAHV